MTPRPMTGRTVLTMFIGGFGIIIAVNVALATNAVRTFPGLEVPNSYVASQSFDARREAQEALGWSLEARYEDGALTLDLRDGKGRPVRRPLSLLVGRPTEALDDRSFTLRSGEPLPLDLAPGRWRLDVTAEAADGTAFERHVLIRVRS